MNAKDSFSVDGEDGRTFRAKNVQNRVYSFDKLFEIRKQERFRACWSALLRLKPVCAQSIGASALACGEVDSVLLFLLERKDF